MFIFVWLDSIISLSTVCCSILGWTDWPYPRQAYCTGRRSWLSNQRLWQPWLHWHDACL